MEECKIKVSVLLTSYNYEQFITEAIDSVINQTYSNWELIIVDDGSTDNSLQIIEDYCKKDSRIKLFQHENGVNKGLRDSLLLGLDKVACEWVAFLESDDALKNNYLEEKIKVVESDKDANFIFNDVELFGDEEIIKGYDLYKNKREKLLSKEKIGYADLLDINFIPSFSTVMAKKDLMQSCNFYSTVPQSLDWIIWAQIITKTKLNYVQLELTKWRKHSKNYSRNSSSNQKALVLSDLLRYLDGAKHNRLWVKMYEIMNNSVIEKLFRPQVGFLNKSLLNWLLKGEFLQLKKINFE